MTIQILSSASEKPYDTHVYFWRADETNPETPSVQSSRCHHTQTPLLVPSLSGKQITDVVCGASHCVAFSTVTGKVFSWGSNFFGELGVITTERVAEPIELVLPDLSKVTQVSCGNAFNVAICLPIKQEPSQAERAVEIDPVSFQVGDGEDALSEITRVSSTLDGLPTEQFHQETMTSSTSDSLYTSTIVPRQSRFTFSTLERLHCNDPVTPRQQSSP